MSPFLSGQWNTRLKILSVAGYKNRKMKTENNPKLYLDCSPKGIIRQLKPMKTFTVRRSTISYTVMRTVAYSSVQVSFLMLSQLFLIWLIRSHACCSNTLGRKTECILSLFSRKSICLATTFCLSVWHGQFPVIVFKLPQSLLAPCLVKVIIFTVTARAKSNLL